MSFETNRNHYSQFDTVGTPFPMKLLNKRHIHEEAFRKGVEDFRRGNLDCPYSSGFLVIREWHRGFNTEYFRNLERVKTREIERSVQAREQYYRDRPQLDPR